jgi:hypothetical protein
MRIGERFERLKIRFFVWLMLTFRLRPRAVDSFDFARAVKEDRE